MKRLLGLILITSAVLFSACSQYTCATYVKNTPPVTKKTQRV
jgi:hypothetical protein